MQHDLERVLIARDEIARRVADVGRQIADDLHGLTATAHDQVTLVPVLTGSIIFVADLIRHLPLPMQISVLSASSYPGTATTSRGVDPTDLFTTLPDTLAGQHVLVVDDILDSGNTLRAVTDLLAQRQPASLKTCVLLRKRRERVTAIDADYACFEIPDEFVVGYGLDYNGYYRNLPEIAVLTPEAIDRHREPGNAPSQ